MTAGVTKQFTIQQRNSDNTDWDTLHPETEISQVLGLTSQLATKPTMTTENVDYYIDSANGNDSNDGLSTASPLKTITAALNKIPYIINHVVTIHLMAQIYAEDVTVGYKIRR